MSDTAVVLMIVGFFVGSFLGKVIFALGWMDWTNPWADRQFDRYDAWRARKRRHG